MPDDALAHVIHTFDRWITLDSKTPLYAVLGAVAANYLDGDPVWLGLIAPPSSAKTEILNSLCKLKPVRTIATLTPAGLLSGTSKKDRANGAKGGLLREIGGFGIIVLKDYGSILTLRPDMKAETIAALREVYDGHWTRVVGTEGGRSLRWEGKIGMIFASTQAYDRSYSVTASLGDRNMLVRLSNAEIGQQIGVALRHIGPAAADMREELSEAVRILFTLPFAPTPPLSDNDLNRLCRIVATVVRLRGHVERDCRNNEILSVDDPEGPGRITIALVQLRAGLCSIGLPEHLAFEILERVAFDTAPPLRVQAYALLSSNRQTTRDIARLMALPTNTVRRVLEDLMCQGLAERQRELDDYGEEKQGGADLWKIRYPP